MEPTPLTRSRVSAGAAHLKRWADGKHQTQRDDGRILNMEITEKQRAIEALRALPEQATIEDAIERLCFIAKIEEGLRQSDARQLVSHDEVKKQFLS
jgi:predicted transcriptional regulator